MLRVFAVGIVGCGRQIVWAPVVDPVTINGRRKLESLYGWRAGQKNFAVDDILIALNLTSTILGLLYH